MSLIGARYYDPIRALSGDAPIVTSITASGDDANEKPRSSPDRALTALCQLGALRIGTQRCMLFFFDTEYAYVLAEATKTLSLQDDDVHDAEDSLWLGYSAQLRGNSICEHTINLPPGHSQCHNEVYIIDDLKENVQFCNRPFVAGGPKARFYAGVPIKTSANVHIGVYCVLDDKPRNGLNAGEIDFMSQMSKTVMSHLEMIRERSELGMATNLLTGLGDLITKSSDESTRREGYTSRPAPPHRQERSKRSSLPTRFHGSLQDSSSGKTASHPEIHGLVRAQRHESVESISGSSAGSPRDDRNTARRAREDIQKLFHTAASLLKTAAEVDGSLFLDASIHNYGGDVRMNSVQSINSTPQESPGSEAGITNGKMNQASLCSVLGVAEFPGREAGIRIGMSEKSLQDLLKKYPRGKVWCLHPDSDQYASQTDQVPAMYSEERELQRLFPGARNLCLVGMWDVARERWYAGTFIWTYSHSRVFSNSTELVFLIAFCDVLMTEITRLESQLESTAKSDFISSISHELRTSNSYVEGSLRDTC